MSSSSRVHPSSIDEIMEIKSAAKTLFQQLDDHEISDASSSINSEHEPPMESSGMSFKSKRSGKSGKSKKSNSQKPGKFLQRFGQNKDELKEQIMQEVMEKILPDIGSYNENGYVAPKKESNKKQYIIKVLKFLGLLTLDLHEAVLSGSLKHVQRAIRQMATGKDPHPEWINQYNSEGVTSLSIAVRSNHADISGYLLENNAIPDYVDESTGRTPIFYSILNANHRITKMLLSCHASVNMVDFQCMSPLMIAASKNDILHVKMLCAMHAEVDLQDDQGWTALHHAAANNSSECMAVLISEGADKRIRDFNRRRPINIAKFKNFGKCIAVLSNKSSLN